MPKKRRQKNKFSRLHYLLLFWTLVGILAAAKHFFPAFAGEKNSDKPRVYVEPVTKHHYSEATTDSIDAASQEVDQLFFLPRPYLSLIDIDGNPKRNTIDDSLNYSELFNDNQDVHLPTAERLGQPECEDREVAAANNGRYVYIGASPYYDLENLTHSVPYLVPRAAILLDEIGRAFVDSLSSKGIPFHKMIVTSVLRTQKDVESLQRRNRNAVEQSCHLYGTTFDIAYNSYHRVQDPADKPLPETDAKTLRAVLGEVLRDQHNLGTCYVKYETHEHCFHITCR